MVSANRKDQLLKDLQTHGEFEWVVAARNALRDCTMQYAGQSASKPVTAARELTEIFRRRLASCQERGVNVLGIDVLITALQTLSGWTEITVDPFLSPNYAVTAFYHPDGKLLACVTVERNPGDPGAKNLAFAMGD
jgi:hypothetical protein